MGRGPGPFFRRRRPARAVAIGIVFAAGSNPTLPIEGTVGRDLKRHAFDILFPFGMIPFHLQHRVARIVDLKNDLILVKKLNGRSVGSFDSLSKL